MSAAAKRKAKSAATGVIIGARGVHSIGSGSNNRRRTRREAFNQQVSGPPTGHSEWEWEEDLDTNVGRAAQDFSWGLGGGSIEPQTDDIVNDGISVIVAARRYKNSDRPMHSWTPLEEEYVQETLRGEGRGSPWVYARCGGVRCVDRKRVCSNVDCSEEGTYRCLDAACLGEGVYCAVCMETVHGGQPAHQIELNYNSTTNIWLILRMKRWNGKSFVRKRTGLRDLGLRVQLGHPPGVVCPARKAAPRDFVLYDLTGEHEINVDFCGCMPRIERRVQLMRQQWWPATVLAPNTCATFALLKLFQILNCLGKLSAYDFLRGLEMCTNHNGLDRPPDRRKPFMHIVRQWRECKRMKRFKRGNKTGGVGATSLGELALPCRACPQPGWNLPEDWDKVPWFYRYLYFLFLAQDANFRLMNRTVSSEEPIQFWWGGEDGYKAHIAKNANEQEISSCSGFQAMFLANSKRVKGLRTTGIAGVTCSRHNMWRPNGIGDLQVGERYCNMDYLMLAALLHFSMLYIVLSYDIACQYSKNFWTRMAGFPESMRPKIPEENIWWKVPNFHLPPHKPPCHSPYSFHFMWGAGMTHGEGVEQNWAFSNGAAASTKLMGPGSRHATLEDIFGFHNYDRQLAMHRVLPKRLAIDLKEGAKHKLALEAFTAGLEAERAAEVQEWRDMIKAWEAVQHTTAEGSPYEYKEAVTTLRDIQLAIAQEEFIRTEDGVEIEQESTPGTFIMMGLELEDIQRRLEIDVKALQHPSATQKLAFLKRRTVLLKKIHKFRDLQRVYMPSLRGFLSDWERQMLDGNGEQLPEITRLFMPSEIGDDTNRRRACAVGLPEIESRMREGEAGEALEMVRQGLRARTLTNRFRIKNYTGQGALTRGQGILRQINIKVHLAKLQYRYSRAALLVLRGHGVWEQKLKVLREEDVRALNERALAVEDEAREEHVDELTRALQRPAGVAVAEGLAAGEGSHTLSWIWYTVGAGSDSDDPKLHEAKVTGIALRVEWCKAQARVNRFEEDIRHLREEMRRTIAYGYTEAGKWDELASTELPDASTELTEGRQAYAGEKAQRERDTCTFLSRTWAGILAKADHYLEGDTSVDAGEVMIELELGDELEPDDEEALLEGDLEAE
ncbi:hypothetical protein B0H15DRAFT_807369 [Mycena belliarum]|uniref:CxC2-like cysteine cluster KDZ transposase-associated domain-containing protein n=1 Tax=Mycena belliarum TaxID=1033014 RepID=A0AAD6TLA5_9AGAR|nr:hypothetical protein B0H15DRAFT_807369 [Mycena belliae]